MSDSKFILLEDGSVDFGQLKEVHVLLEDSQGKHYKIVPKDMDKKDVCFTTLLLIVRHLLSCEEFGILLPSLEEIQKQEKKNAGDDK